MPKNREKSIELAKKFLREISDDYRGTDGRPRLTSAESIHAALVAVDVDVPSGGRITPNMIRAARRGGGPAVEKQSWDRLIAAICGFELADGSSLLELQTEIRQFWSIRDDTLNDTLTGLFAAGQPRVHFDAKLIGEYVVYRQVTDTANVEKALLSIHPVAARTGMKFQFVRADHDNRGRYAQGRILDMDDCFTAIGSLYNPIGDQSDGIMVAALAKLKDESRGKINAEKLIYTTGVHSLFSDYVYPCSTKMVILRSGGEDDLLAYDSFADASVLEDKINEFCQIENYEVSVPFEQAVFEIEDRTGLPAEKIGVALSNETSQEDTLHYSRSMI